MCDPARGGVPEGGVRGGFPYLHGCCCVQARDRYSPRQGCFVQARDKSCDPARGGVLEGGVRGGGSPPGTAAVSKRETGTVTKQTTDPRGGGAGWVSPTGTAAVSKHETGTVTKQTTGAFQFMVDFALRGGGWLLHIREHISLVVHWEAGGPFPNQHASDLFHNF